MTTLRYRCKEVLNKIRYGLRPIDTLLEFVISEQGRAADNRLEEALPLCLYFISDKDRDEFISHVRAVKPELVMRKV